MRLLFLAVPLLAQISPELHPNQSATFRLLAPKATAVTLWADWMPNAQSQPLAKDPNGLWSLTTGPLEPGGHLYWFNLDGLPIADPINPVIKLRQRTSASIVEIPSPTPAPWDLNDVPHGTVITEWRHSKTLGRTERVFLYLPPGYEGGSTRYPVLYLIHGKGDIPDSWTNAGRANFILDNLIASKKARSMILVMPAGHAAPYDPANPTPPANAPLFTQYLTNELIPVLEAKYRIAPGPQNRALAGFSMGGELTIHTAATHPKLFSRHGVFSAGPAIPIPAQLPNFWISAGDTDTALPRARAFAEQTKTNLNLYKGPHNWTRWRLSLNDFAQLLFPATRR